MTPMIWGSTRGIRWGMHVSLAQWGLWSALPALLPEPGDSLGSLVGACGQLTGRLTGWMKWSTRVWVASLIEVSPLTVLQAGNLSLWCCRGWFLQRPPFLVRRQLFWLYLHMFSLCVCLYPYCSSNKSFCIRVTKMTSFHLDYFSYFFLFFFGWGPMHTDCA